MRAARFAILRGLAPAAAALSFQGGFAIAVMILDRSNRGLSSNVGYVIAVELVAASLFLGALAYAQSRRRKEVGAAIASPLDSATPPARAASDESWRELLVATKAEALKAVAAREARSRDDLDAFLASVHAMKTPATALSLMTERAEREGGSLSIADARLEIDELDRILDRALGRLRLGDFERGSRIRAFDAALLARSALRKHRRLFIARGVAAEVSGGFEAESDPDWIAFILDQLVSNAAKHAASKVVLRLESAGRAARIDVVDDGPGFGPEDGLRAFGRSAAGGAGAASSAEAPSSSGYGLYLAREAARRLGATLEIAPCEGACLRLTLARSPGPLGDLSQM
jgi:signal transduction histidine kinase